VTRQDGTVLLTILHRGRVTGQNEPHTADTTKDIIFYF
jgi:hypothetical protein